ncbi:MAG: DUF5990 family protein [Gemmatimonadales bacterium]
MARAIQSEVPIRIVVVSPVPGVLLRVQGGRSDLLAPSRADTAEVVFDLTLRVGPPRADGQPNFLGAFAQGPPAGRFIYVNAGRQAGQFNTPWDRRAKIPLKAITREQLAAVLSEPGVRLEVQIAGRAGDGGPACASVSPLRPGWRVRKDGAV